MGLYFCLINGVIWVWCSYVLAFLGKPLIAESLSQVAMTEIISVFFAYSAKSVIENLSMNNQWPDKKIKEKLPDIKNWEDAKGEDENECS